MTDEQPTTKIYLIRHGATDANLQRPYILQGQGINHGLSELGQKQAIAAGQFLKPFTIDHIYCSPLQRAQETAQSIAKHHDKPIQIINEITEVDVGAWEGMAWERIMEEDKFAYDAYMANPGTVPYKNGESYQQVAQRALPALETIAKKHLGETIAVVAHNVVNRAVLANIMQIDIEKAKEIRQNNTGINVLRFGQKGLRLITLNSTFHLEQLS